jgi:hypothetical protein
MHGDRSVTAVFVSVTPVTPGFTALYDRIWHTNDENNGYDIALATLSGDGSKLAMATTDKADPYSRRMRLMSKDGSGDVSAVMPGTVNGLWYIDTDQDGSVAYCSTDARHIYKFDGATVTKIFDVADHPEIGDTVGIKTTATGDWVYFLDDEANDNDIWRISSDGATKELVVDDKLAQTNDGKGFQVSGFDISADGNRVAFTMFGYLPDGGGTASKPELFVKNGGDIIQLTDDSPSVDKTNVRISGDGSVVMVNRGGTWTAYGWDGSWSQEITPAGNNFGGLEMDYEGSSFFFNDSAGGGGSVGSTDRAGIQYVMPYWNVTAITLAAHTMIDLSDDGTTCCFRVELGSFPFVFAFYVGEWRSTADRDDAPDFGSIWLSPGVMPRGYDMGRLKTYVTVNDPDGDDDVERVTHDTMIDGKFESDTTKIIARFFEGPRNDGDGVDEAIDDVWTAYGEQIPGTQTVDEMTIRISAQDKSKTIRIGDVKLLAQ